jgi:hypothetical protein
MRFRTDTCLYTPIYGGDTRGSSHMQDKHMQLGLAPQVYPMVESAYEPRNCDWAGLGPPCNPVA